MPSRRVKTLYKELGHRMHREHRSKRGRQKSGGKRQQALTKQFKRNKQQITELELEQEKNIILNNPKQLKRPKQFYSSVRQIKKYNPEKDKKEKVKKIKEKYIKILNNKQYAKNNKRVDSK